MRFPAECVDSRALESLIGKILKNSSPGWRTLRVPKHNRVYTMGESDDNLYLVESGRIELQVPVSGGRSGVVGTCGVGDVFGESCLSGDASKSETAVALSDSSLLQVPREELEAAIGHDRRMMSATRSLAVSIAEKQQIVTLLLANRIA